MQEILRELEFFAVLTLELLHSRIGSQKIGKILLLVEAFGCYRSFMSREKH